MAFAIIYFFWLKDFRTSTDNLSDYVICKNSNLANAKLKLKIDNYVIQESGGNLCKTEYLSVPEDQELHFIAKKLAGCWDQYLEGKEALFDTEDNTYCAMCSVLEFKDDTEIKGLTSYLMENKVPFNREFTYFEYLNRVIVTKEQIEEIKNAELVAELEKISTETQLAVIFIEGKDINPGSLTGHSSIETGVGGTVIGAVVGGVAGIAVTGCILSLFCAAVVTVVAVVGAVAGGTLGYFAGSDLNPDLDSRILLWRYTADDLRLLHCNVLEGQDQLEVKNY